MIYSDPKYLENTELKAKIIDLRKLLRVAVSQYNAQVLVKGARI